MNRKKFDVHESSKEFGSERYIPVDRRGYYLTRFHDRAWLSLALNELKMIYYFYLRLSIKPTVTSLHFHINKN